MGGYRSERAHRSRRAGRGRCHHFADLNRNGQLDEGEPFTLTIEDDPTAPRDETGEYWLEELLPGE